MNEHVMRLHGSSLSRGSGPAVESVLAFVSRGTEGAVRMAIEGRSVGKGKAPKWLQNGSRFDLKRYSAGKHELVLVAPPLQEVLPKEDESRLLPTGFDPSRSGLDLFESALHDGIQANKDSERIDSQWAEEIGAAMHELFSNGVERLEIGGQYKLDIGPPSVGRLQSLSRQAPPKQATKVVGKLEAIRHSNRGFVLQTDTGELLRGIAEGLDPDLLASMFGKRSLISGFAVFRASKHLLRIEADDIRLAETKDEIFVATPRPLFPGFEAHQLRQPQGTRSGLGAIIGQWPGNETDEEICAAIESLR